jgi:GT2 family glycosyltransferase
MLCLDHIRKFTDRPYELIIIDPVARERIRDDYQTLELDASDTKHIQFDHDPGYTGGMNWGASQATGEVLVFIQNDVFVREGWLPDLLKYIEDGWEVVWPDQVPRTREYVLESYKRDYNHPDARKGGRDAGLMMITKRAFDEIGGWNEKLGLLAERDIMERIGNYNIKWTETNKVYITHIMAATNRTLLDIDPEEYDRRMTVDAAILNK